MEHQELKRLIENVWQNSRYYGDMLFTAIRLYENEEYYASVSILFNATELVFKSVRENYSENFNQDILFLKDHDLLSIEEYEFLSSKQSGIREIRNIMTHRDAYQHCLEDSNGKAHLFSESSTWKLIFENYAPTLYCIINKIVINGRAEFDE